MTRPISGPAGMVPRLTAASLEARKPSPEEKHTPAPDGFATNGARSRPLQSSQRNPQHALAFVERYEERLGLSAAAIAQRRAEMAKSPAMLFRMTPALFHADLQGAFATDAILGKGPAPRMLITGDSHLGNFGTFRGPGDAPVFGLNDFDQSGTGSPEWDLERLTVSVALHARERGLSPAAEQELVAKVTGTYLEEIQRLAAGANDAPYLDEEHASGQIADLIEDADSVSRGDLLEKFGAEDGTFDPDDELLPVSAELRTELVRGVEAYANALPEGTELARPPEVLDVIEKLNSGGSTLGLPRYYALVSRGEGKTPALIELKSLTPSPMDDLTGDPSKASPAVVIDRQKHLGGLLNPLTGLTEVAGRSFLVREREPEKDSLDPSKKKVDLAPLATTAARLLARTHAAPAGQAEAISRWIDGSSEEITAALQRFSSAYADQVLRDHAVFAAAAK